MSPSGCDILGFLGLRRAVRHASGRDRYTRRSQNVYHRISALIVFIICELRGDQAWFHAPSQTHFLRFGQPRRHIARNNLCKSIRITASILRQRGNTLTARKAMQPSNPQRAMAPLQSLSRSATVTANSCEATHSRC